MAQDAFISLGRHWSLPDDAMIAIEKFTCGMYGKPKMKKVNEVRAAMLKDMVKETDEGITIKRKVDLVKMPPCLSSLRPHLLRVNYRAGMWKRAHENCPDIPAATSHGWCLMPGGHLEPQWCDGEIVPQTLADLYDTPETEKVIDDASPEVNDDHIDNELDDLDSSDVSDTSDTDDDMW